MQIAALIASIVAAVVAVAAFLEPKVDLSTDAPAAAGLEVSEIGIGNIEEAYNSLGPFGEQTLRSTPQVRATVTNSGAEPVSLRTARVTIEQSAALPLCVPPQGAGPVPETKYPVTLPLPPTPPGLVGLYRLRERLAPGEDSYPVLHFGVRRTGFEENYLYALRVELLSEEGTSLDLGRVVLALPGSIRRSGSYLPESDEVLERLATDYARDEVTRLRVTWCFRRNLDSVRRIISMPGRRSGDLKDLAKVDLAPSWDRYADPRPPRAAATALLAAEHPDAPVLAAFAASLVDDPEFASRTRARAAAILRRQAEEEMGRPGWGFEVIDAARESLALLDTPATRELLREAEARLEAELRPGPQADDRT